MLLDLLVLLGEFLGLGLELFVLAGNFLFAGDEFLILLFDERVAVAEALGEIEDLVHGAGHDRDVHELHDPLHEGRVGHQERGLHGGEHRESCRQQPEENPAGVHQAEQEGEAVGQGDDGVGENEKPQPDHERHGRRVDDRGNREGGLAVELGQGRHGYGLR